MVRGRGRVVKEGGAGLSGRKGEGIARVWDDNGRRKG